MIRSIARSIAYNYAQVRPNNSIIELAASVADNVAERYGVENWNAANGAALDALASGNYINNK